MMEKIKKPAAPRKKPAPKLLPLCQNQALLLLTRLETLLKDEESGVTGAKLQARREALIGKSESVLGALLKLNQMLESLKEKEPHKQSVTDFTENDKIIMQAYLNRPARKRKTKP